MWVVLIPPLLEELGDHLIELMVYRKILLLSGTFLYDRMLIILAPTPCNKTRILRDTPVAT